MNAQLSGVTGTVHVHDGIAVVRVSGEIDIATVGQFQALIDEAVARCQSGVEVDLVGVDFIDGRAVTVLVHAAHELRAAGAPIIVSGASAWIYRLFTITDVVDLLGVQSALPDDSVFARRIGRVASMPPTRHVLDAALQLVATMSKTIIANADGASITLPRDGNFVTVAASNDTVLEMDHDQYDTGEGPCLDAATSGGRVHVDALRTETRWPAFAPRAISRGIESILSTPLLTHGVPLGALNIYSKHVAAFATHELQWADQFAAEAAAVVSIARAQNVDAALAARIEAALDSRETIAMAQGVVMQRDGISRDAAYTRLRDASRRSGTPLREVCEALVQCPAGEMNRELSSGGAHGLAPK